jgi:eukaryotic-like serine/threonine-protein kinase
VSRADVASGRYRVERTLGHGGMATVVLAEDSQLGRRVALKQLADHLADDPEVRSRFVREARLAARLSHPNVVAVFDAGEEDALPYIVMEYVEGETLADVLKRERRLDPAAAVDVALQACGALQHAHDAGLVHRDVKPGNLLVRGDGTVKIADFGIARAAEATQVTDHGTVLGTAAYLAPEQARGEQTSPASDVYALAAVLYEMLAGRPPFEFDSLADLVRLQERTIVKPPGASPALDAAVLRALSADPAARPASAAAFADELRAATATPADAATAPTFVVGRRSRRRRPRERAHRGRGWIMVAGLLATVAVLILAVALARNDVGECGGSPAAQPPPAQVEPVPRADDPEQQARNLSEWIRENSR